MSFDKSYFIETAFVQNIYGVYKIVFKFLDSCIYALFTTLHTGGFHKAYGQGVFVEYHICPRENKRLRHFAACIACRDCYRRQPAVFETVEAFVTLRLVFRICRINIRVGYITLRICGKFVEDIVYSVFQVGYIGVCLSDIDNYLDGRFDVFQNIFRGFRYRKTFFFGKVEPEKQYLESE